jgi:hypothetical protein
MLAWVAHGSLLAAAKPADLARLDDDLTPLGAQRPGNAAGSIPAWNGGLQQAPPDFSPGMVHPDPFSDEAPLLRIDADNLSLHAERLTPGHAAMLQEYAGSYFLDIYPTHRSAAFPQRIYAKTRQNGVAGRLTADGEGVLDVAEGFPFPFPESGRELIWNHKLKYKGLGSSRNISLVAVTRNGEYQPVSLHIDVLALYQQPGATLQSAENRLLYYLQTIESPPRLAGTALLVHESLNQSLQPRSAWTYNPAQRRVIRAPQVAYDNPAVATDGLAVSDMADMFNGAMDRFDWSVQGKRELYVPYNAYRAHGRGFDEADLIKPGHLNPALLRYELHRVWVVEARLREGHRHLHPRRTYYLDEDSYQILLAEHYDKRGELWRFSEAHPIVFYEVPMLWTSIETHHDLQTGRYVSYRQDNRSGAARFDRELSPAQFSPQALRRRGRR